ncbi:hypothetical protein PHSY_003919 [Pseudozyma hubeiensis SY62]|uniref:Palmitoyltransferase PFA4 n=1 Tax=Pseudozyma hubeiensis (strain SY62) TaxID=1305764 RepID=R9P4X4_PSEHS|nr:hypothetical protein PHSY_003919 [Pseudozyma hubeiensis SY62]GAC96339.1 hypothetical protein PHSY_003919 [Pseudozyma hubeiensis SY62]
MTQLAPSHTGASAAAIAPVQTKANSFNASHEDPDDGAYPSSESDDDGAAQAGGATTETRSLLAMGDEQASLQDKASAASIGPVANGKRRTPLKWTEIIWVTLTLSLIAILGYSSQLRIMLPYYHKTPSFSPRALAAVLVPFNLGLLGIFFNYWLCVTTDPGAVPLGWQPEWSALDPIAPLPADSTAEQEPSIELKQAIYRPRYCKTCSAFKPPRSHHCKTCRRCVLRMDHHCPWLANCVGHFNYPHFIRFLLYVDITCAYHLVMISCRVLDKFNSYTYWREPSGRELVWLVVNYALCIPVILLVGVFSGYHFYCVAVNQTTIEGWEKDRTATMVRRGRVRKVKYPYDLGVRRNVREVVGSNPLTWCWPGRAMRGDGLKYPVASGLGKYKSRWRVQTTMQDCDEPVQMEELLIDEETYVDPELEANTSAQYRWPPKDPTKATTPFSSHGWRADGTQAPDLFAPLPPGATSSTPFTYGSGFNPNLRPTNSGMRYRGTHRLGQASEDGEESLSSNSDDEIDHTSAYRHGMGMAEPDADELAALDDDPTAYTQPSQSYPHTYDSYSDDDDAQAIDSDVDDSSDDDFHPRVAIRRGSEGYEVRPLAAWTV